MYLCAITSAIIVMIVATSASSPYPTARSQRCLGAAISVDVTSLLNRKRNQVLPVVPRHAKNAAWSLRRDANDELLHRCRQSVARQVDASEILVGVIVGAPLTGFTVDNELGSRRRRQRPESVFPRRHDRAAEHEILVSRELSRGVRACAPDLVPRHDVAKDHTTALQWPAVSDLDVGTRNGRPGRVRR